MAVSVLAAPTFEKVEITEVQLKEAIVQLNDAIENDVLRNRNLELTSMELAKSFRTTV